METLEKGVKAVKVNNKNTRTMSITSFTTFSSVSIVDSEQVNVSWASRHGFAWFCSHTFFSWKNESTQCRDKDCKFN